MPPYTGNGTMVTKPPSPAGYRNHRSNPRGAFTGKSAENATGSTGDFEQPHYDFDADVASRSLCLALDDVQDPGNLGTIVRIADWFGIEHIFCSNGTADIYNPKTVQATMGAIARVKLHYCNLPEFIGNASEKNIPVFGTFLDGENIYTQHLPKNGIIVMGNEGNGISEQIARKVSHRLLIPNYPQGCETSESLNVAVATAIVCAEFRRRAAFEPSL